MSGTGTIASSAPNESWTPVQITALQNVRHTLFSSFELYLFLKDLSVQKYNIAEVYRGTNLVKLEKIFCSNAFKTCATELHRSVHEGQWTHKLWSNQLNRYFNIRRLYHSCVYYNVNILLHLQQYSFLTPFKGPHHVKFLNQYGPRAVKHRHFPGIRYWVRRVGLCPFHHLQGYILLLHFYFLLFITCTAVIS